MLWAFSILAALAETQRADQARGRAQQLEGRLGLRQRRAETDLRTRVLWAMRQFPQAEAELAIWSRMNHRTSDGFPQPGVRSVELERLVPWFARQLQAEGFAGIVEAFLDRGVHWQAMHQALEQAMYELNQPDEHAEFDEDAEPYADDPWDYALEIAEDENVGHESFWSPRQRLGWRTAGGTEKVPEAWEPLPFRFRFHRESQRPLIVIEEPGTPRKLVLAQDRDERFSVTEHRGWFIGSAEGDLEDILRQGRQLSDYGVPDFQRHVHLEPGVVEPEGDVVSEFLLTAYYVLGLLDATQDATAEMLDTIEDEVRANPDFRPTTLSFADAFDEAKQGHWDRGRQAWHKERALQGGALPLLEGDTVRARWPDGAQIVELGSAASLTQEGQAMAHCVGSHWPMIERGDRRVFSYRDPEGRPQVTVEVTGRSRRCTGVCNEEGQVFCDLDDCLGDQERDDPNPDCRACDGTGWINCPECGGDAFTEPHQTTDLQGPGNTRPRAGEATDRVAAFLLHLRERGSLSDFDRRQLRMEAGTGWVTRTREAAREAEWSP